MNTSIIMIVFSGIIFGLANSLVSVNYMTNFCNKFIPVSSSGSGTIEISPSLTYPTLMDCTTVIEVSRGYQILLYFNRFIVESKLSGQCVDYLEIYDGDIVNSERQLSAGKLCGTISGEFNITSSGGFVTLRFRSDSSAGFSGFALIYTAFHYGPCSTAEFDCQNNLCISDLNKCDNQNNCGNNHDELSCAVQAALASSDGRKLGYYIGAGVAGVLVLAIILKLIHAKYVKYMYKKWMRENALDDVHVKVSEMEYPITSKYYTIR